MWESVCEKAEVPRSAQCWTAEHHERAVPYLQALLPLMRLMSLSAKLLIEAVEPLQMLKDGVLIAKYRFDALQASEGLPPMTMSRIRSLYPESDKRCELLAGLRGKVFMSESLRP